MKRLILSLLRRHPVILEPTNRGEAIPPLSPERVKAHHVMK
jgi:hypothetical protein